MAITFISSELATIGLCVKYGIIQGCLGLLKHLKSFLDISCVQFKFELQLIKHILARVHLNGLKINYLSLDTCIGPMQEMEVKRIPNLTVFWLGRRL